MGRNGHPVARWTRISTSARTTSSRITSTPNSARPFDLLCEAILQENGERCALFGQTAVIEESEADRALGGARHFRHDPPLSSTRVITLSLTSHAVE